MAQVAPTTVPCPNCRQSFNAVLEQVLDVGQDPNAKQRLLNGQVNNVTCPHCGYHGMIGTPLLYHDPQKELFLVHVPLELGLNQIDQEKLIGDMANRVMNSLPAEERKAYLLQPTATLTMQGMVDQVLEADGITKEVIKEQQDKIELVQQMALASTEEQDQLIQENAELLDMEFFDMLNLLSSAASQQGQARDALRFLNLRTKLLDVTEAGQEVKVREQAISEATRELQALGQTATREDFIELLVNAADNPYKVEALGTLGRQLLDYTMFAAITERIDASKGETKEQLTAVRDTLLKISAAYEQAARDAAQQAASLLGSMLNAPDVKAAIRQSAQMIDDNFMAVLQINLDEARKAGNVEASTKLKVIRDEVLAMIQESAPPEVRLINDLLSIPDETAAISALHERKDELNEDILTLMDQLGEQLRQGGNEPAADRLDILREEAISLVL